MIILTFYCLNILIPSNPQQYLLSCSFLPLTQSNLTLLVSPFSSCDHGINYRMGWRQWHQQDSGDGRAYWEWRKRWKDMRKLLGMLDIAGLSIYLLDFADFSDFVDLINLPGFINLLDSSDLLDSSNLFDWTNFFSYYLFFFVDVCILYIYWIAN